jgi:UDP-N-acetylglucosamine 4-epimerase
MYEIPYHTQDLSKLSFLITGGAGFIGSNLVNYLLKHKAGKVRVLDNLSNGFEHNISSFKNHPDFEFLAGDITDYGTCLKAFEGIDFISHQAAMGSVPRSLAHPDLTTHNNVTGTLNVLRAAVDKKVKRVVYASSSSVYGNNPALPKKEENIGIPLSPYAASKQATESLAGAFYYGYDLPTIGLRYFNVFGPNQSPDLTYAAVIPLFAKAYLQGGAPFINGDGTQSRDFTFIENVVQANIKAFFTEDKNAFGKAVNVGNNHATSVNDLASILKEKIGSTKAPEYRAPRKGDVKNSLADISNAQIYLGYDPKFTFDQGIEISIDFYKKMFAEG